MKVKPAPTIAKSLLRNQSGQLTIFLAIGLTLFLTMMAFIINVGLFVRAKINLQNATDAAAWSGAAVQARQLSQIAYLNYEIRNVYKEWMFKYYVLGNLGHVLKMSSGIIPMGDFRTVAPGNLNANANHDRYNIPSICVHAGEAPQDICLASFTPGLPRFETIDLPNITDESQQFIDAISSKKADDCSYRSSINFATALIWTYGTGGNLMSSDLPALANGRLGAWPAAFLLGVRMRTLEAMVNRPPIDQPICFGGAGCLPVQSIPNQYVANERPIKAFYALLRNYSGGKYKETDGALDETMSTLKMEELVPNTFDVTPQSLSGMLIPNESSPWNPNPLSKRYLDLQAVPVNYAIFYTTMSARSEPLTIDGVTLPSDSSCSTTKTAIPVPAYITGFQKNPKILTYYAVRSSVNFTGLFFPFSAPLEISAVAAAKPFGGRIGPRLFTLDANSQVQPRRSDIAKSAAYISGLKVTATGANILKPGVPIPTGLDFWVADSTSVVGGVPGASATVPKYSIPNMIYNATDRGNADSELSVHYSAGSTHTILTEYTSAGMGKIEKFGLYDGDQFEMLLKNLTNVNPGSTSFNSDQLTRAVQHVRQPTIYDSLNYMIPVSRDFPNSNIKTNKNGPIDFHLTPERIDLYGPIIDTMNENSLYRNTDGLQTLVNDYITNNKESIEMFLENLKGVAIEIKNSGTGVLYDKAAEVVYPLSTGVQPNNSDAFKNQMITAFCSASPSRQVSVAARFSAFLQQKDEMCADAKPLAYLIKEYVDKQMTDTNGAFGVYHSDIWYAGNPTQLGDANDPELGARAVMTAYRPGALSGATADGKIDNPLIGSAPYDNLRNYYSTKLIQLDIVTNSPRSATKTLAGVAPSLIEESSGSSFDMLNDVRETAPGDYDNKLQEPIDVMW